MYEVAHISNLIGEAQIIISLKKLEDLLEELQQLRKYKRDNERNK